MSEQLWACSDILSGHFKNSGTSMFHLLMNVLLKSCSYFTVCEAIVMCSVFIYPTSHGEYSHASVRLCAYTDIRDLSEERDDSIGENHHLSRKLGRIERTLDRMDHDKHKVSFMQYRYTVQWNLS